MNAIFIGHDGKLRSGWRAFLFLIAFLFIGAFLVLAAGAIISQFELGERAAVLLPMAVTFAVSSSVSILMAIVFAKAFEGLPASSLGLGIRAHALKSLGLGCLIGGIAIGSGVLIGTMGGGLSLSLNDASSGKAIAETLLTTLFLLGIGAVSEETLFRGYLLQTLVRSRSIFAGVAFTSLMFALIHNGNPGASPLSFINTALAGVWFALAYLKAGSLWFPIGLHFMWNWIQGPVLGINVSGLSSLAPDPVFRATDSGPALLTGGTYGIEGGVACTIAIAISIGVIYFLPIKPAGS